MSTKNEIASGLTAAQARELLRYDRDTGKLFYRRDIYVGRPGRIFRKEGDEAGCLIPSGYIVICIDYVHFRAHRLAWLIETGDWPTHEIDHRDMDRSNNRWANLREATGVQNRANSKKRAKSGFKGVITPKHAPNCFVAQISVEGKPVYLGTFRSPEEAHAAYLEAAIRHHGEFARAE
jgi:hypothetical protein